MKRRRDIALAFCVALCLHSGAALWLGRVWERHRAGPMPAFRKGSSSVELTLVPAAPDPAEPRREQPEPEPIAVAVPQSVVTLPEPEPEETPPEPEPEPEPEKMPEVFEAPVDSASRAPERNADLLRKGVATGPEPTAKIRPVYPIGARERGEQGVVRLRFVVTRAGRARDVRVAMSSGYRALDRAALRAVRRAEFRAAQEGGGIPHEQEMSLTFEFRLQDVDAAWDRW